MVEKTRTTQATEDLQAALEAALASGLTQGDIVGMVAGAMKRSEEVGCQSALPDFPTNGKPKVYRELPPGLITLPDAARKYEINYNSLHRWVKEGKIRSFGRLRGPAPGRGLVILMECEVLEYRDAPRLKSGRPKKK